MPVVPEFARNMFKQMRLAAVALTIGSLTLFWNEKADSDVRLVKKGQGKARIVISESASPLERFAADELKNHIGQITGAKLPILGGCGSLQAGGILPGANAHFLAIGMSARHAYSRLSMASAP